MVTGGNRPPSVLRYRHHRGSLSPNGDEEDSWEELPLPEGSLRPHGHGPGFDDSYESHPDNAISASSLDNSSSRSKLFDGDLTRRRRKSLKGDFQVEFQPLAITLIAILIGLSLLFVKYMDGRLPEPLTVASLNTPGAGNYTKLQFIEERARRDLEDLTNSGPRISGSELTDIVTVKKITDILTQMKIFLHDKFNLEFEVQRPSGAFVTDHVSVYNSIANVVAKLELKDPALRSNHSILLNCHFDSKPSSPGATDNMISCVSMLEVLRDISFYKNDPNFTLINSVVFLFNGAEELGLQGAHGFVKGDGGQGHRWSRNLKTFINLEGAGASGREILFQTGPGNGWILKAYAKVAPYPYGLVMGEEAFQLNLIPSDTDFRIFRDFRDIPGLDMAFIKNGWIYHTKWDKVQEITPGSIQHMGANTLALVEYLGDLDFDQEGVADSDDDMVFFDVFGLFMIAYSETVGIIINISVAILFIGITVIEVGVKVSNWKTFIWLPISILLSWGGGVCASVFVGALFNWCGYFKPFYSYPALCLLIFGPPAVLSSALVLSFAWNGAQKQSWLAGKVTIALLIMVLSFVTRSVYILTLNLVFATLAWVSSHFIFKRLNYPKVELVVNLVLGELIPFMFATYLTLTLADVFVPIQGRSPSSDSNIFLGLVMAAIILVIAFNGLVSYFVNCKKIHLILALVISVFLVNPLIVFGIIGKIPFQEKTPMRLRILHLDKTFYNPTDGLADLTINRTDAGYWLWPEDPNTRDYLPELARSVPELKMEKILEIPANRDNCVDLYCSQPFLWPTSSSIKKTPYLQNGVSLPPSLKNNVVLDVVGNDKTEYGLRNLTLSFRGPSQMSIVFSPGLRYDLVDWSLKDVNVLDSRQDLTYMDRPTYFIYVGNGFGVRSFNISLIFEEKDWSKDIADQNENDPVSSCLAQIMYVGHFLHDPSAEQWDFKQFSKKLPMWTTLMSWSSVLKQYTIL